MSGTTYTLNGWKGASDATTIYIPGEFVNGFITCAICLKDLKIFPGSMEKLTISASGTQKATIGEGCLSGLDTTNVTGMNSMFNTCNNLITVDVRGWDTSNVKDMSYMFYKCNSLTTLELVHLKIGMVQAMTGMFYGCVKLKNLDLSTWDSRSVDSIISMFYGCPLLEGVNLSSSSFKKITYSPGSNMFYNDSNLKIVDLSCCE